MNCSAGNSTLVAGSRHKDDMPMRTLVQTREILIPNIVVLQKETGNETFGGCDLVVGGRHRLCSCQASIYAQINGFRDSATGNVAGTWRIRDRDFGAMIPPVCEGEAHA
jgi:hypothetical protein